MYMYHDSSLSEDLRKQLASVLEHVARENNEADETLIRAALTNNEEKPAEKADVSDTNRGKEIVNNLQDKLEDFLKNYESESDEEEETCALSRSTQPSVCSHRFMNRASFAPLCEWGNASIIPFLRAVRKGLGQIFQKKTTRLEKFVRVEKRRKRRKNEKSNS